MNHGYCKNGWWWQCNWCYYENVKASATSYCPDYINRKKTDKREGTLTEWITKNKDRL